LANAVSSHMVSDVPLGLHLSGGLDSSALLALMSQKSRLQCFTLGFGTPHDEFNFARRLAEHFGAQHQSYLLQEKDLALFPRIATLIDEPIGDAIVLPIYLLYSLSQSKITVVLTGEGGDELFGGYIHNLALVRGEQLKKFIPPWAGAFCSKLPEAWLTKCFPYPARLGTSGVKRLGSYLRAASRAEAYLNFASLFSWEERVQLYAPEFKEQLGNTLEEFKTLFALDYDSNILQQVLKFDLHYWLPDYTLFKQDRLAMACSQEGRFPFLDRSLVQWSLKLPPSFKIRGFTQKYLLRKALSGMLPAWAQARPKQAFYFPIEKFLQGNFGCQVKEVLAGLGRRQIINTAYLDLLWKTLPQDALLRSKQIMTLYLLELWLQNFSS
jgi:asparagine synthase (glutamine-hydrolysing)